MVPVVGLEPTSLRRATDFKSVVFANFTTLALIKDKFEIKCKFLLLSKTHRKKHPLKSSSYLYINDIRNHCHNNLPLLVVYLQTHLRYTYQ